MTGLPWCGEVGLLRKRGGRGSGPWRAPWCMDPVSRAQEFHRVPVRSSARRESAASMMSKKKKNQKNPPSPSLCDTLYRGTHTIFSHVLCGPLTSPVLEYNSLCTCSTRIQLPGTAHPEKYGGLSALSMSASSRPLLLSFSHTVLKLREPGQARSRNSAHAPTPAAPMRVLCPRDSAPRRRTEGRRERVRSGRKGPCG